MPAYNINSNAFVSKTGFQAVQILTANPDVSDNARTYLTQDVGLGATLLPVRDTTGINIGNFVIIGNQGGYTTEIVRVVSILTDRELITTPTENAHAAAEKIQLTEFDKIEIWRADYEQGSFVIITTLKIDVTNINNLTMYYDQTGDEYKYYQTSFLNSFTNNRVFSPIFRGGKHEWGTPADVKMQANFPNLTDKQIEYALRQAYVSIVQDAFVFLRGEILNRTNCSNGETRWNFQHRFIADGNMDDVVDTKDITVYEYDGCGEYDITNQVSVLNVKRGYLVFNEGYPTNNRGVKCDFYFAKRPHEEIRAFLKEAATASAVTRLMTQEQQGIVKKGITGYSTDGVQISKSISEFRQVIDDWQKRYLRYVWLVKPLFVVGTRIGGYEQPAAFPRFQGWY